MTDPLEGAIVWDTSSRFDELILRTYGSKFIRVQAAGDGENGNFLIYDRVIQVDEGVWASVPDEYVA